MFGLPSFTFAVMVAIPSFWILYTVVFLVLSRHWSREDDDDADPPGGPLSHGSDAASARGV